jgi:hypothetical protein
MKGIILTSISSLFSVSFLEAQAYRYTTEDESGVFIGTVTNITLDTIFMFVVTK